MKKIVSLLMIMILAFTFVACGGDSSNNDAIASEETSDEAPSITVESGSSADDVAEESTTEAEVADVTSSDTSSVSVTSKSESTESDTSELIERVQQNYQSGQLTAGEWNDNENFDYFMNVLNDNNWYHMTTYWNFMNWSRYEFSVKNDDGAPITNALVELHDGQQNVYYSGRTNNKGYVAMYPFLDKVFIQQPHLEARITYNQDTFEIVDMNENDSYFKVTIDAKSKSVSEVDIMLMIDTTGSMEDELGYLKLELADVIKRVNKQNANNLDIRVSSNYYRDRGDQYLLKSFEFTTDLNQVVGELSQQDANGGGDYEEAVVEALNDAIYNHDWNENAGAKLLFLVLDAPPHHTDQNVSQIHELMAKASAEGIRIIPIASSGVDKETEFLLRFMAINTNGTYTFLTNHSGIGNSHITPTIGQYQVEQLNDLMVRLIDEYVE